MTRLALLLAHANACALPDLEAAVATPYEAEVLRAEVAGGVGDVIGFALAWFAAGFERGSLRAAAREAEEGAWAVGLSSMAGAA